MCDIFGSKFCGSENAKEKFVKYTFCGFSLFVHKSHPIPPNLIFLDFWLSFTTVLWKWLAIYRLDFYILSPPFYWKLLILENTNRITSSLTFNLHLSFFPLESMTQMYYGCYNSAFNLKTASYSSISFWAWPLWEDRIGIGKNASLLPIDELFLYKAGMNQVHIDSFS